jgi:hypothetical protein
MSQDCYVRAKQFSLVVSCGSFYFSFAIRQTLHLDAAVNRMPAALYYDPASCIMPALYGRFIPISRHRETRFDSTPPHCPITPESH